MLARYFNNAALNIGGGPVSHLTEDHHSEHDNVKRIREVYPSTKKTISILNYSRKINCNGFLETSIQRNLVVGILDLTEASQERG